jgi:hypothetical protein
VDPSFALKPVRNNIQVISCEDSDFIDGYNGNFMFGLNSFAHGLYATFRRSPHSDTQRVGNTF